MLCKTQEILFYFHLKIVFSLILRQIISISLLLILGMTLLPWQSICIAHPFGHEHHHHDGPSPCELRRIALQQPGENLLPQMDCDHISKATDDYSQTQLEIVTPSLPLVAVVPVVFDLVIFEIKEQPFLIPPTPHCRSASLFSDIPLRGPPLV